MNQQLLDHILNQYSNCEKEVLKLIVNTYEYLLGFNKEEAENFLRQLNFIKESDNNFTIRIDAKRSYFDSMYSEIVLDNRSKISVSTFIHELTHGTHCYADNFTLPNEFNNIKNKLNTQEHERIQVLEIIKERQIQSLKLDSKDIKKIDFNLIEKEEKFDDDYERYSLYGCLSDIIDSLSNGRLHDKGINYVKDNNSLVIKSGRNTGHGEEYFSDNSSKEFEEIIANYAAIRNSKFKDELFAIMKLYPGKELLELLENYYLDLINKLEVQKIAVDDNKNIIK